MRKLFISLIALVILSAFLIVPQAADAKSPVQTISKKSPNDPYVLINYRAVSKGCTQTTNDQASNYAWTGWKIRGLTDYKINFQTKPKDLPNSLVQDVFGASFSQIQGANNGILFHYAGESRESSPSNDGQNTLMWRALPMNVVAVTYVWVDNESRLAAVDTVFNNRYRWSYTNYNGRNDCGGSITSFDLKNIATHEFGHWIGLGDLYDVNSKDLTMYGYASRGELKKDNLGVGDTLGVRAVWP